jgi:hypothetical protein
MVTNVPRNPGLHGVGGVLGIIAMRLADSDDPTE